MCELHPQWIQQEDLTRESANDLQSYNQRFEEKVGKIIGLCNHNSITRLTNGNFYCHQCETELQLVKNERI